MTIEAYWGRYSNKGMIWMGYKFDFIRKDEKFGEIYTITGLIDSPERIASDIKETSLMGTTVVFLTTLITIQRKKTDQLPLSYIHCLSSKFNNGMITSY